MKKPRSKTSRKIRRFALYAVFALNTLAVVMIVVPHFGPILAEPFEDLKSYLATNNLGQAEQELERLKPSYGAENELQRLEAEILRRKSKDQLLDGDVRSAAESIARSRTLDFPEIRAALRVRNWSRAAGLYALLAPEEKNDPAGKLLLAELRIGQGEEAYQSTDFFTAREYYREAYRLWPGHPLVYRRYHELMAMDLSELRKKPVQKRAAQSPPPAPAPEPDKKSEQAPIQVIVVQGETRTILNLPASEAVPARQTTDKSFSYFEGGLLGLLLLTNLQLLLLLRRRVH